MTFFSFLLPLLVFTSAVFTSTAHAEIKNLATIESGAIYRGSKPEDFKDLALLDTLKIKTIISFETMPWNVRGEEELLAKSGIEFINLPIPPALGAPSAARVDQILELMNRAELQPVFIHCYFGRDRTGMISALYRVKYQGWTPEQAYAEWRSMGYKPAWQFQELENFYWEHARKLKTCSSVLMAA